MRYQILQPSQATFNVRREWASHDELYQHAPVVTTVATEFEATRYVRGLFPDAVCMPAKISIGSGEALVCGVIADDQAKRGVDVEAPMPFALLVLMVAESGLERRRAKQFDRDLWKQHVILPDLARSYTAELRASELPAPMDVAVKVGAYNGKLAIALEVNGSLMSLVFDEFPDVMPRADTSAVDRSAG